jgi:hypothetical protein
MRDPRPGEETGGPELDVTTKVKDAVPMAAATDGPVRAVENGRCVGIVDRELILKAMAGGPEESERSAPGRAGRSRQTAAPKQWQ